MEIKLLELTLSIPKDGKLGIILQFGKDQPSYLESKLPFYDSKLKRDYSVVILRILALGSLNEQRNLSEDFEPGEVEWMRTKELIDGESQFRADILRRIGQELYNTIFPDNKKTEKTFKKAYGEVNSKSGKSLLHLKIQYPPNLSLLDNYPWELICKEGKFFCEYYCSISRMFDGESGSSFQKSKYPDKKLLIISSRGYDDSLGILESEKGHILNSINSIRSNEDIPIDCIPDLSGNTYTILENYLSSINRLDILHFDGHGRYGKLCICGHFNGPRSRYCNNNCNNNLPEAQGYLLFESSSGRTCDYISAEKFANCIGTLDSKIKASLFILITACKSSSSHYNDYVFEGIAQKLMSKGIPATLAIQYSITTLSSKEFVGKFYKCLAEKKTLVQSLHEARKAITDRNHKYSPVLYLNMGNNEHGTIFKKTSRANKKNSSVTKSNTRSHASTKGHDFYIKMFVEASDTYLQCLEIYNNAKYLRDFLSYLRDFLSREKLLENPQIKRHCKEQVSKIKDTISEIKPIDFNQWSKLIRDDISKLPKKIQLDYCHKFKGQTSSAKIKNYQQDLNDLKQQCESVILSSDIATHEIALDITEYCNSLHLSWREIREALLDIIVHW